MTNTKENYPRHAKSIGGNMEPLCPETIRDCVIPLSPSEANGSLEMTMNGGFPTALLVELAKEAAERASGQRPRGAMVFV